MNQLIKLRQKAARRVHQKQCAVRPAAPASSFRGSHEAVGNWALHKAIIASPSPGATGWVPLLALAHSLRVPGGVLFHAWKQS
jgi:hypothetical protein